MMENKEWKESKIKEIAEVIGGGTPRTDNSDFWNGDIPWITPRDLTGYSKMYISKGERMITNEGLKGSSTRLLPKGTVLLTSRAPIGYVAIAENEICTNQGFKSLVLNEELTYNKFIYYWIKNNVEYLQSIGTGTTFAEISGNVVKEIDIKLPPLPEQKAIASVLSSLDDKIDLLHQQNQTLEALAETLFRQWFIEEAKEDWEDCTIGDLAIHSKVSIHPKKNQDTLYHHYSIPSFDANKKPVVELGKEIQSNKYAVQTNSILFSKLNPHKDKRVWLILDKVEDNAICSTELQVVKPKEDKYLFFLYGWLTHPMYYNEIASGVGGTSGSHQRIDPKSIFSAPCVHINESLIDEYNNHAEPLFKKQFENQQQIQTLTKLRDTLLPKLMSDEVRVKV
ncbi:restriction endonuclease subunit S [Weeksellaceae bacterium A-14]